MTNPKGTAFESLLVGATNAFDPSLRLYRPAKSGAQDHGDIHGASPFIIQAKDWANVTSALNEGLNGAVKQAKVAGEDYGVAVIKRRGKSVGDAYAVMRYEDFVRVLLRLRDAEGFVRDSGWAGGDELGGGWITRLNDRPFPRRKADG